MDSKPWYQSRAIWGAASSPSPRPPLPSLRM
jgi:hypothetical protein